MKKFVIIFLLLYFTMSVSISAEKNNALAIMYHRISDTEKADAFTINSKTFEEDIRQLLNAGYEFCTACEFNEKIQKGHTNKIVAITFDDGYSSDFEKVLPILEKYKAKATFFIIGKFIGTDGYLSKQQLKALSNSQYTEIGNHTYFIHSLKPQHLRLLYKKDMAEFAVTDFLKNKQFLEEIISAQVNSASYPLGIYESYLDSLLKQKGIITFSSNEEPVISTVIPFGRFNRANNTSIEKILARVNPMPKTPPKKEQYLVPEMPKGYEGINFSKKTEQEF